MNIVLFLFFSIIISIYMIFVLLPKGIRYRKDLYVKNKDEMYTKEVDFVKEESIEQIIKMKTKNIHIVKFMSAIFIIFFISIMEFSIFMLVRVNFVGNDKKAPLPINFIIIGNILLLIVFIIAMRYFFRNVIFDEKRAKYMLSDFSQEALDGMKSWYENRDRGNEIKRMISALGLRVYYKNYFFTSKSIVFPNGAGNDMPIEMICKDISNIGFTTNFRAPSNIDLCSQNMGEISFSSICDFQMYKDILEGIRERGGDPKSGVPYKRKAKIIFKMLPLILPVFILFIFSMFSNKILPKDYSILPNVRLNNTQMIIGVTKISKFIDDGFDIYLQKKDLKKQKYYEVDINEYFSKYRKDKSMILLSHSEIGDMGKKEDGILLVKKGKIYGAITVVNSTRKDRPMEDCVIATYDVGDEDGKVNFEDLDIYADGIKVSDLTYDKMEKLFPKLKIMDSMRSNKYISWDEKDGLFRDRAGFSFFISFKLNKDKKVKSMHVFSYDVSYTDFSRSRKSK